ncbi:MAG: WD40 repeat domain-containing protein [Pseudonocardiaceae bacterium]
MGLNVYIPAVVAMQFAITDPAAIRFAQSFYEHVAKRRPVDDSVRRARLELRRAEKDSLEWGTPVLYLRTPEGQIFGSTIAPQQAAPSPDLEPSPETPPTPAHQKLLDPPPPAEPCAFHNPPTVLTLRHRYSFIVAPYSGSLLCDGMVYGVTFSPDGRRLATAGSNTARVWDAATGQELLKLAHRPGFDSLIQYTDVTGVAFSPDGRRLATACYDGMVRIWDASRRRLAKIAAHIPLHGVVFSPDGNRLASAGWDMRVRVWDATSGQQLTTVTHDAPVGGVVFSPDGHRLATASWKTARIWVWSQDDAQSRSCGSARRVSGGS